MNLRQHGKQLTKNRIDMEEHKKGRPKRLEALRREKCSDVEIHLPNKTRERSKRCG